jgi:modulator of FtsH protease
MLDYGSVRDANRTRTLFGQVMGYVTATTGLFTLGAYLGRSLGAGAALVIYLLGVGCLIGMRFAVSRAAGLSVVLLFGVGFFLGLALAPTLVIYADADPQALWQAAGATALFMAGCGAAGYATRSDLSVLARLSFWALFALIAFGILLIFVDIPGGTLIYAILALVVFAGLTVVDFQRLRRTTDLDSAPLIAASIFLDLVNVFLSFLRIFRRKD